MGIPYNSESLKHWDISGEVIVALAIIAILIVFAIIVGIQARRQDYKKSSRGPLFFAEWAVEKLDNFVSETMGKGFETFGGLLLGIIPFLFLSFVAGITGLPTPMNNIAVPLSLALITFTQIHYRSMKFTKWKYFKRYVEPFPFFLPVNLISMWAPLLSLTLRMFGNALVGWVLLGLVNWALTGVGAMFVSGGAASLIFVPIGTPLLHAYFDVFSAFIQTLVFTYLTVLLVAQEKPEDYDEQLEAISRKELVNND